MNIGIIGAGNLGARLATGWLRAGHAITFGVRDPGRQAGAGPAGVRAAGVADAARDAEVVALATPWPAVPDALAAAGALAGKILIDCTNPLRFGAAGLELEIGHTTSGGETVAALVLGAAVVKTLNQTGFANMEHAGGFVPLPAVMYVAGDNADAKRVVLGLVSELGFQAIDAGKLAIARLLEPMAMLWIHMTMNRDQDLATA
jgi:predicted dinucleotide-binding enzyme